MSALIKLARPEIVDLVPYSSARREQSTGKVWLNANENPWQHNDSLNRYPDPQPIKLISTLSEIYEVEPEKILACRGSDEAIDLLLRVFCNAKEDGIIICPPTYGMYKIAAQIQGAQIVSVPLLLPDFALDVSGVLSAWRPNLKLIMLCSPNNPTANLLSTEDILSLCGQLKDQALIVVDEAYIEFASTDSLVKQIDQYPNLVILRTLSKAYGLAGARCGVVLAQSYIIELLKKVLAPYPIPRPMVDLVVANLSNEGLTKMQVQVDELLVQRQLLIEFLNQLSIVEKVWPSETNFILVRFSCLTKVMQACLTNAVVIRDRSKELGLENCARITVGTPIENQILMEVLNNV